MVLIIVLLVLFAGLGGGTYAVYRYVQKREMRKIGDTPTVFESVKALAPNRRNESRRLGYRWADDYIFVHGSGVYCGFELATKPGEYATGEEIDNIAMGQVGLLKSVLGMFDGKNVHCQELVRYRAVTTEGWLRQLIANAWNPTHKYQVLAAAQGRHISGAAPQRMWTLIVRLGDLPLQTAATDPLSRLETAVTGISEERLTAAKLGPWRAQAAALHRTASRFGAEPMTRRDLLWLIRKTAAGHLPVADDPVIAQRAWRGGTFELLARLRARNLGGGYLELSQRNPETGEDNVSYTATLVLADQPPRQVFSARSAWMPRLSKLPVEINWRYTLIPGKEWKKFGAKLAANVADEEADRDKAGAPTDLAFDARLDQAVTLMVGNAEDPDPGMQGRLRLLVSAPSLTALAQVIRDVKSAMGDIQVELSEYAALDLLAEQLPGENIADVGGLSAGPAGGLKLWTRYTDTYAAALGLLGTYDQVGDRVQFDRGRELGWVGIAVGYVKSSGTVFHFDPHAQIDRLNGAGVAIVGSSGGGKSSFALTMFFWMSESGVHCYALDPKIEFRNFIYYLCFGAQVLNPEFLTEADEGLLGTPQSQFRPIDQEFSDNSEIIDLARGARGIRDPWTVTKTFNEGYNLALSLVDILFNEPTHKQIVKKGLRRLHDAHKSATAAGHTMAVGFGDVVTYIEEELAVIAEDLDKVRRKGSESTSALRAEKEDLDEVVTRLRNGEEQTFLRLLLGRGADARASTTGRSTKRRTVYTMAGFITPDNPDRPETWTDEDRNASALMTVVMYDLRRNLDGRMVPRPGHQGDVGIAPTAVFVDEANMITAVKSGRSLMVRISRQGRSLACVLFFICQQPRDPKAIEEQAAKEGAAETNQFASMAAFKQRGPGEAAEALQLLRPIAEEVPLIERREMARRLLGEEAGGNLRPGQCVFRDPDARVVTTVVDQMFFPLQWASETNPKRQPLAWANELPNRPEDWSINPVALAELRGSFADDEQDPYAAAGNDDIAEWASAFAETDPLDLSLGDDTTADEYLPEDDDADILV
jgi:hypothetical protein